MKSVLDNIRDQPQEPDHGKALIHGESGTGKTTLASTIAKEGAKTLFLYVPGEEGINSLNGLEWEDNLLRHRLTSIEELWRLYWDLYQGEHDLDAVVVDSVSALQVMWKKHLLGLPLDEPYLKEWPEKGYGFWGSMLDEFTEFFTFWYGLASSTANRPIHVVMTSQTKQLEDATGAEMLQPDLHKGPLSAAVSRPDYILYTHMEDDDDLQGQHHAVRIKPASNIRAKTRGKAARKLPDVFPATKITLPGYFKTLGVAGL